MPDPRFHEGFVVLNEEKIPPEITHELKHYNGLVNTFEKSKVQEVQRLAIINSERKLLKLFEQYPDLYPNHIVYGYIPLIELLKHKSINPIEFIQKLKETGYTFGNDYLKKLLLFEPTEVINPKPRLGWASHLSLYSLTGIQKNMFMLAMERGDQQLIKAILELISDPGLKKAILLQCMQLYQDSKLSFKTMLEMAVETGSAEFLDFITSIMDELGILTQAANEYIALSNDARYSVTLLTKACELENEALVRIILKHASKLVRVLYISPDESGTYPDYIFTGSNYLPVFIKPLQSRSPVEFELILNATLQAIELNPNDSDFISKSLKMSQVVSSIAVIDLNLYVQHSDFYPQIFTKILNLKIELHKQLHQLEHQKAQFYIQMKLPQATVNGNDLQTQQSQKELWNQSLELVKQDLNLSNVLQQLLTSSLKVKNYQAAALILITMFNNQTTDKLFGIIKDLDKKVQDKLMPLLFIESINGSNVGLIEYLCKNKVKVKKELFQTLCTIKDADTFIFMTLELFHNLHQNKLSYTEYDLKSVLEKTRSIARINGELKEPVDLLLNELEHYKQNYINYAFFSKSKHKKEINALFAEIRDMNDKATKPTRY